jgi:hypothetical protein
MSRATTSLGNRGMWPLGWISRAEAIVATVRFLFRVSTHSHADGSVAHPSKIEMVSDRQDRMMKNL